MLNLIMKPRRSITKQVRQGSIVTDDGKTKRKSSYSDQSLVTTESSSVGMKNTPENLMRNNNNFRYKIERVVH